MSTPSGPPPPSTSTPAPPTGTSDSATAAPSAGTRGGHPPTASSATAVYPTGPQWEGPPGRQLRTRRELSARWREIRSRLTAWWYLPAVHELRSALHDARRAPGWLLLGFLAVCWVAADFTWLPAAIAVGAWLLVQIGTYVLVSRWYRWRWRRRLRPLIGVAALAWLVLEAGWWAWTLAAGLWLIGAALTDTLRARRRLLSWVLAGVTSTGRVNPDGLKATHAEWDGRRLVYVEVRHHSELRSEEPAVRERIARAVKWRLRHAGAYQVSWPAGMASFEIRAEPPLPRSLYDQEFPPGLPGIPVGVTDTDNADGMYEVTDARTGELVASLPLVMVDPEESEKHWLVVGGTGAGKTTFTRGFIARGLRLGWFPGGVWILDGKGSGDYIVFEGREGVRQVARKPGEWEQALVEIQGVMENRYEEDAEYERGNRDKPDHPRYLVVLEENQQIRSELTAKVMDPFLQQLSRQMRGSNGRLMVVTQRPDAEDAIPGAVRDMLENRFIWGFVSAIGARMVLDKDASVLIDEYGAEPVPGCGVARIDGRLIRLQGFNLDSPRKVPSAEVFYPPKLPTDGTTAGPAAAAQAAPVPTVWAPRLVPPPANLRPEEGDPDELVPAATVPRIGPAAVEEQGDPFTRKRRRTV